MAPPREAALRSDRRYVFAEDPDELWAALTAVHLYQQWWPWLRGLDAAAFAAGERWDCVVQPPLPYSLRFSLLLEEVDPPRFVVASLSGDIEGQASLDIMPATGDDGAAVGGSELRLISVLRPTHRTLQLVQQWVPGVARFGHDWVLDAGLRQFRQATAG